MNEEMENQRWTEVNHELGLSLPPGRYFPAWRNFAITLWIMVQQWEAQEQRNFRHRVWDFCVIHSRHEADTTQARDFKRLLETTFGLSGRTLDEVELGENTLEAASAMVLGSTKVFFLVSRHFNRPMTPKFIFQEALMQELQRGWRNKLVPMYLPGPRVQPPFGMANMGSLTLGHDLNTSNVVNRAICLEAQMEVRQLRHRAEANLRERLARGRQERLEEVRQVVTDLRNEFGDDYDPNDELNQICNQLPSLPACDGSGVSQLVNVRGSTNISVGPSFHFAIHRDTPPHDEDYWTDDTESTNL